MAELTARTAHLAVLCAVAVPCSCRVELFTEVLAVTRAGVLIVVAVLRGWWFWLPYYHNTRSNAHAPVFVRESSRLPRCLCTHRRTDMFCVGHQAEQRSGTA